MKRFQVVLTVLTAMLLLTGEATSAETGTITDAMKAEYRRPLDIPFPDRAPYTPQMATLGKMLYFDPRLSGAKNMTCASCHNPSFGFEVPVTTPVGAANTALDRQAPTILNMAWVEPLFWDGRAATLEEQAAGPMTASVEMNGSFNHIIADLQNIPEYRYWFDRLFPAKGVTQDNILTAIATYERTVVSGWAPFDRWIEGEEDAISEAAKRGFVLFNNKAGCFECHGGWNFTDNKFHDIGLPSKDIGRGKYEPDNIYAQHAMKTPTLRNLTHRAPFMHDGSVRDLKGVIDFYATGGVDRPSRSPLMLPLILSEQETSDLVIFLQTLTADKTDINLPILPN